MGGLLSWLTQVMIVTMFNLRNIGQRMGWSLVTILGVAGVVFVVVSLLSIASGFQATMQATGDPAGVIVLRSGSDTELSSNLSLAETRLIADAPGVARGPSGALASAELFVVVDRAKRSTGTEANVPLRGVQPRAFEVRREIEIVEGRNFEPGRSEIIVGRAAADQFAGLDVGSTLRLGQNDWSIVGIFSTGGTVEDTELWCDARVLQPAYRRGDSFQSVRVKLTSAAAFDAFKDALTVDPRVNLRIVRESEYYAEQSSVLTQIIRGVGGVIGILMGFGAVFGALNTMYTAVSARSREIATLRALGFGTGPVVISVLVEAVILAAMGGLAGALLAYVIYNGYQAATLNWQTFSQVAFTFAVTPSLLIGGMLYAIVMGLVGGFFPAIRAARLPVATALRVL